LIDGDHRQDDPGGCQNREHGKYDFPDVRPPVVVCCHRP
jgi:hypothetical protein